MGAPARLPAAPPRPNILFILADNLGYGDLGCYGATQHRTPHVDALAREGLRLTGFYAASGVCTPSRASLLTGCYPRRVNLHQNERGGAVLQPVATRGLHPDEVTVAEVLRAGGYATALIGKWHLGDQPPFLPTRQGFDYYFGIPYSDDMTPRDGQPWPPLPLMRQEEVIEAPVDRDWLTRRYTEESIRFIHTNRTRPFFLLLSHAMPGSTTRPHASPAFQGRSANGPWGDAVEEIDWSTGELLRTLRELGLERNTLVVWTSDNGAPRRNPPQGSNRPLGGWGYTTAEGGMRVPCVVRWPGRIPGGRTSAELLTMMDWLPTLAALAGGKLPADRVIDGRDIWPVLAGEPAARSPHEHFYYYQGEELQAVRDARWKLYPAGTRLDRTAKVRPVPELYDLRQDEAEAHNRADEQADVVARLLRAADAARAELGDLGRPGRNNRPAGEHSPAEPRVRR